MPNEVAFIRSGFLRSASSGALKGSVSALRVGVARRLDQAGNVSSARVSVLREDSASGSVSLLRSGFLRSASGPLAGAVAAVRVSVLRIDSNGAIIGPVFDGGQAMREDAIMNERVSRGQRILI